MARRALLAVAVAAVVAVPTPSLSASGLAPDADAATPLGVRGTRELGSVPGFAMLEDEASYDGLHVLTRYLLSRESDRVLVVRAAAAETSWADFAAQLRAAIATFAGDAKGSNAPAPPPP